ncbi:Uncharacterized protein TCM_024528 [Theobroma cacao]|uniref:Uncharacterized protein n=1 Tax=Theobroma cacao TaxID=3641 RepID=A0A061EWF6_THECC|nr:Uncharacterized protein TCM_024528 [Theobroma cacao]
MKFPAICKALTIKYQQPSNSQTILLALKQKLESWGYVFLPTVRGDCYGGIVAKRKEGEIRVRHNKFPKSLWFEKPCGAESGFHSMPPTPAPGVSHLYLTNQDVALL